jgi:hypothetical protein
MKNRQHDEEGAHEALLQPQQTSILRRQIICVFVLLGVIAALIYILLRLYIYGTSLPQCGVNWCTIAAYNGCKGGAINNAICKYDNRFECNSTTVDTKRI